MTEERVHAWYEIEQGEVQAIDFCGGQLTHFSRRCPTREATPNEDAACAIQRSNQSGIIAGADGVGGAAMGNRASAAAIQSLVHQLTPRTPKQSTGLRGEILDAIEKANREIVEWRSDSGSTLVAIEFAAGTIRSFHIGDSNAMLLSSRGRIKFATVGHAPIAIAVDIGMLDELEALLHEDRNLISNCLGSQEMRIEIGPPVSMATRDTLVVASDGLFDNLTSPEIAAAIATGNLQKRTREMAELVTERMAVHHDHPGIPGKPDDLTIVCFRR